MITGQKIWNRAKKSISGGNMLFSKRPDVFLPDYWPSYFKEAKGCLVTDLDNKITALLENKETIEYPVSTTLFYRYLKRIVSHIVNASTALIMPTDQIDYLDE